MGTLGGSFIRWAGGKSWFCKHITKYLPDDFIDYYEPFLGGGSIFFYLSSNGYIKGNSFLSDLNLDLIKAYIEVKDNCENLISFLSSMKYTKDEYYRLRNIYNEFDDNLDNHINKGALFIYLNRTGFNGIYRVSRSGKYNVPYGVEGSGEISNEYSQRLRADSSILKTAILCNTSYDYILKPDFHFKKKSLVFLDPPYTVSHNNNGFIEYNKKIFDLENQYILRKVLDKIDSEGSYFIMTNAHHKIIRDIFDGYYFFEEERQSLIGGINAERKIILEYIVCNFIKEK